MLSLMARWEPDAVGRLQKAAMQLYREPGYDKVTVAEIAERADVTRRTFFRYFADTREVLFYGAAALESFVAQAVLAATRAPALEIVVEALAAVTIRLDDDKAFAKFARQRYALIQTYAELRERDLAKLASLASAASETLRRRGFGEPAASLAAEAGMSVFKIGFERWIDDPKHRKMAHHLRETMRGLETLVREKRPPQS